ncbi:MAG: OmpA family protein, partial [bacterium]
LGGCATVKSASHSSPVVKAINGQNEELSAVAPTFITAKGLTTRLAGDSLFKPGSARLSAEGKSKVDSIAAVLKRYPMDQISVLDYTDNSGSVSGNLRISKKRAEIVQAELVAQAIPAAKMTAAGMGEADPIVANKTAAERAQNRRVELEIVVP